MKLTIPFKSIESKTSNLAKPKPVENQAIVADSLDSNHKLPKLSFDSGVIFLIFSLFVLFKLSLFSVEVPEYEYILQYWFDFLKNNNFTAFKSNYYNYQPLIIYLLYLASLLQLPALVGLKAVLMVFDFVLSLVLYKISRLINGRSMFNIILFLLSFVYPSVVINSSMWGRLDVLWLSMGFLSLYYLLKKKYIISAVFYGLAFAFKPIIILVFPVFLILVFNGYWKVRTFFLFACAPVLVYLMSIIPAFLAGRSLLSVGVVDKSVEGLLVLPYYHNLYFGEIVSGNMPNIYIFMSRYMADLLINSGIGLVILVVVLLVGVFSKLPASYLEDKSNILELFFWVNTVMVYLSPTMQDNYYMFSDILGLLLMFIKPKKYYLWLPVMIASVIGQWKTVAVDVNLPLVMGSSWLSLIVLIVLVVGFRGLINKITIKYEI
jgi:Gpi18-like mannosyltransferase